MTPGFPQAPTTTTPSADPLGPLKQRLAAIVLVAMTTVGILAAVGACAVSILGRLGAIDAGPYDGLAVACAGAAAGSLLLSLYRRVLEPGAAALLRRLTR